MSIRVLLADDQTLIRDGLRAILEMQSDITVVGEAQNGAEAHALALSLEPDVVLMDIRMPLMDGVEATQMIKRDRPKTVVIVLTTFDDDDYIIRAMTCGAAGYLLKDTGGDKLIAAIRDGLDGSIILPGRIAAKITSRLAGEAKPPEINAEDFSEREKQIIRLLLQGMQNREIAGTLFLSVGTVKNYVSQIYEKIGVRDRTNAMLYFHKLNL